MKRILIGHRGAGKSCLLKRHESYFPQVKHFDLDAEIEKLQQKPLTDFFNEVGESEFRRVEREVFKRLQSENSSYVIAPGAGFNVAELSDQAEVLFVSRVTDADGRIFLNRPRLEPQLSALEEYRKRYGPRHEMFLKTTDSIYYLSEGITEPDAIEKSVLEDKFTVSDAYYTLSKQEIGSLARLTALYKNIELRSDLISSAEVSRILKEYPHHNWLVSIRTPEHFSLTGARDVDCDYLYYSSSCTILSSHTDKIQTGIKQLASINAKHHLKLCPLIEDFSDLVIGYQWQQEDPKHRSFLPRSLSGKWVWYRQLAKYLQKINFVKNYTDIHDQPSTYEWLCLPQERPMQWGAVLGSPVYFSRSPQQHRIYFEELRSFFSRIDITPTELSENILFLNQLGMNYAAVTSPLKETLFKICDEPSAEAAKLSSANTLFIANQKLYCHNTDTFGFTQLVSLIGLHHSVAVWGGGGTLEMIKSVLPQSFLYSGQTGELRDAQKNGLTQYDFLIWAAPRSHKTQWPDDEMKVGHVIDLNYTDNSMGLEFASMRKISYTSGLEMFKQQALMQQKYWNEMRSL